MKYTKAEYGKMQLDVRLARAMYWHAMVVSGAYKARRIFHGTETSEGNAFTDEEKLADALATMDRHLHLADEIVNSTEIEVIP